MSTALHFIRPYWFCMLLPMAFVIWRKWRRTSSMRIFSAVCDAHLLPYLVKTNKHNYRHLAILTLFASALCMIISLAGPSWTHSQIPLAHTVQPRVIVLDLSEEMLENDLLPNRLTRAKFKLHDLLKKQRTGQLALIVYTSEPFVVSPLTDDATTIDALVHELSPGIMPIQGLRLDLALAEAKNLITQSGFHEGEILVLTASVPSKKDLAMARLLARNGIHSSILPTLDKTKFTALFNKFTVAGQGVHLTFVDSTADIEKWLTTTEHKKFSKKGQDFLSMWRDDGRWFLLPALLFLCPLFSRDWLQRVST